MEDDLKILKVKYLSNYWSDFPQILNLSLGGQNKIKMLKTKTTSNGRRPQIFKVEYLSNHWSDFTQILNLSLGDQAKIKKCLKRRRPLMEDDLKILKVVSQQPLVRLSSNFKLKLKGPH